MEIIDKFSFLKGKKIFITGHTGFKGVWMLSALNKIGAIVKGYALEPNHNPPMYNLINAQNLCESVFGDILDSEKLHKEIDIFEPDLVIHFAAQPLVRQSYKEPIYTFQVNTIGTANVLESVRTLKNPCPTICITTDKVYQNFEWWYPYRENDRLGGYDPYSASKAACEIVIQSYRSSYFNELKVKLISLRAGNVIGGGDFSDDRIIPDFIRALEQNTTLKIRNPFAVRPWQHVLEPTFAYLLIANKLLSSEEVNLSDAYNIGPMLGDNLTVLEVVKTAIKSLGRGSFEIENNIKQLHEAKQLKLDISLAINELDWKPIWDANTAIEKTMYWYAHYKNRNPYDLTNIQIDEYLSLL